MRIQEMVDAQMPEVFIGHGADRITGVALSPTAIQSTRGASRGASAHRAHVDGWCPVLVYGNGPKGTEHDRVQAIMSAIESDVTQSSRRTSRRSIREPLISNSFEINAVYRADHQKQRVMDCDIVGALGSST